MRVFFFYISLKTICSSPLESASTSVSLMGDQALDLIEDSLNTLFALLSNALSSVLFNLTTLEIVLGPGLLATTTSAVQNTMVSLTADGVATINTLTSVLAPIIEAILNLLLPVSSSLSDLAGPSIIILKALTSSIGSLVTQLGNAVSGNDANVNTNLLNVANAIVANAVQLINSVAACAGAPLTGAIPVTTTLLQSIAALIVAHIPAVNLAAQVIAQAAAIVAPLNPTLSQILITFGTALANSLSGLGTVVSSIIIISNAPPTTNSLANVVSYLNGIVANLIAALSPTVTNNVDLNVTGVVGGILSAASYVLANIITGVNSLITFGLPYLGNTLQVVLGAVSAVKENLTNTINTLASLAAGSLNSDQVLAIFGNLLNSLISNVGSLATTVVSVLKVGGDKVAPVLRAALIQILRTVRSVATAIASTATGNAILTQVSGIVQTLLNNLFAGLAQVSALVVNIVGGVLNGVLAVVSGLAAILANAVVAAAQPITDLGSVVVSAVASDVTSLASRLTVALNQLINVIEVAGVN